MESPRAPVGVPVIVEYTEEEYPDPKPGLMVVERHGTELVRAVIECPCGTCHEWLDINLVQNQKPTWTLEVNEAGAPTIRPSVHRGDGCKSHFHIVDGTVAWV